MVAVEVEVAAEAPTGKIRGGGGGWVDSVR